MKIDKETETYKNINNIWKWIKKNKQKITIWVVSFIAFLLGIASLLCGVYQALCFNDIQTIAIGLISIGTILIASSISYLIIFFQKEKHQVKISNIEYLKTMKDDVNSYLRFLENQYEEDKKECINIFQLIQKEKYNMRINDIKDHTYNHHHHLLNEEFFQKEKKVNYLFIKINYLHEINSKLTTKLAKILDETEKKISILNKIILRTNTNEDFKYIIHIRNINEAEENKKKTNKEHKKTKSKEEKKQLKKEKRKLKKEHKKNLSKEYYDLENENKYYKNVKFYKEFKKWINKYFYAKNFSLESSALKGKNLSKINFSNSDLNNANLTNTNLTDAILTDANLTDANLTDANLTDANLTDANLTNAILTDANLTNANLTNANLTNANLTNANLTNANLTDAILTRIYLDGANLTKTKFSGSIFYNWKKLILSKNWEEILILERRDGLIYKNITKKEIELIKNFKH